MNCSYAIANQALEAAHGSLGSGAAQTKIAIAVGRARRTYLELLEREDLPMRDETRRRLDCMHKMEAVTSIDKEKIEHEVLGDQMNRI